ncbi:MAG: hypothetical protein OSJ83_00610 [Clostridia bacterium]|nr:hypothetical protein [Clostridia bacterium]
MKKLSLIFLSLYLLFSSGLTACGSDYAKIYGIVACVGASEDNDPTYGVYYSPYADKTTLAEDDYILEVGKTYHILVDYSYGGGSRVPVITDAESVIFKYDTDALEIQSVTPNDRQVKHYSLICKQAIRYSAILIELDEYSYTLIVSANKGAK